MKKRLHLAAAISLAWLGLASLAHATFAAPVLPLERTPPQFALPNNPRPTLAELIQGLEAQTANEPGDVEAWYQLGLAYADAGKFDHAVSALQTAVQLRPGKVLAWENLGINLYFDHRPDAALEAFQKAVTLGASDPEVWNSLGAILIDLQRYPESDDALQHGFKLTTKDRRLWNTLGMLRDREGKDEEALAAFKHALEVDPDYAIGWNNLGALQNKTGTGDAVSSFKTAVRLEPNFGQAWVNLALAYLTQKDAAHARDAASQATMLLPNDPDAWIFLAQSCRAQSDWEPVVESYHQAIDVLGLKGSFTQGDKRDLAAAYAEYGNGCTNIQHYDDAEKLLQQGLAIDPESANAWTNLAFLRMMQGKSQEALDLAQKALAFNPNQADAWVTLGSVYFYNLHQPADAVVPYQKAVALQPDYSGAWMGLGRAEQQLQNKEEAARAFRKATDLNPTYLDPWRYLAATTSDPREADLAFATALSINPNDPQTYSMQGALYSQRQDWSNAETVLRQSLALKGDDSLTWGLLSAALIKQHKAAEAATPRRRPSSSARGFRRSNSPTTGAAWPRPTSRKPKTRAHPNGKPRSRRFTRPPLSIQTVRRSGCKRPLATRPWATPTHWPSTCKIGKSTEHSFPRRARWFRPRRRHARLPPSPRRRRLC